MTIRNLDRIFHPATVAIIGASEHEGSVGYAIMRNITQSGYKGKIVPVNKRHKQIQGYSCYASVSDYQPASEKNRIDMAIIATPIASAPQIVRECIQAGAAGAIIISAGGKEIGAEGIRIESAVQKEIENTGFRIIGPNCLGIITSDAGLNASFASHMTIPGKMAFISQSGAICTSILDLSLSKQIGFSYFASLGSMMDVDFGDLIDFLGHDPGVSSIIMYIESLNHIRKFMSAARAVSRIKPIIALKAGRTQAGARAAASHTGAMAGEDAVYDAALKRAGIVRVHNFEELFDIAEVLSKQPLPAGPGMAVITNAGGPGVMVADVLSDYGIEPVALRSETIRQLNAVLPSHWSHGNPIDIIGDASPERYRRTVEICMKASEVNALLIMLTPQTMTEPLQVARSLVPLLKDMSYPVFISWMGGVDVREGRILFDQAGIPSFHTPERAVRAFMHMYQYSTQLKLLQEIPEKLPRKLDFDSGQAEAIIADGLKRDTPTLTEVESKNLLAAYGIPVNPTVQAGSVEAALEAAQKLKFPLAMKLDSRDISHKTDADGVQLNLTNPEEIRQAYQKIMQGARRYKAEARIDGVTLQPMLTREGQELIMGAKLDPEFGPIILFGMGGILTEVLKDTAIALPPLNRLLARRLMQQTRVYQLLKGFRNLPAADLMLLEEILIRLSQLVTDFPEIAELDINPLLVSGKEICAVDARVMVRSRQVTSPHHLVISPYPNQYEQTIRLKEGQKLEMRPIRPEDAPLFRELFESLSPQSVYMRFFSPIRHLPHDMLARFTQIDYDRQITMVAMQRIGEEEKMVGVGRIHSAPDPRKAEFSILVHDAWQHKGLGFLLLGRCLEIAREHGIHTVYGYVLAENTKMLALGKRLGFERYWIPESNEYQLIIALETSET
jgi:acetyltransferase